MNIKTLIYLQMLILAFFQCVNAESILIEISKDIYKDGYPAVWFSPSTGEIFPVDVSHEPPSKKFAMYIEPEDGEFVLWDDFEYSDYLIYWIGRGDELFLNTKNAHPGTRPLKSITMFNKGNVYIIEGPNESCAIQIISMTEDGCSFRWRKI